MTCEAWDIVAVPFPFTERGGHKKRPALVISNRAFNQHGHTLLSMITSSSLPWPGDTPLKDLTSASLSVPCVVRLKLFTLDNRLLVRRIGQLSPEDRTRVTAELKAILPL